MPRLEAKEVQITLESGRVLDFQASLGDTIVVSRVETYVGSKPITGEPLTYYTISVTPGSKDVPEEG